MKSTYKAILSILLGLAFFYISAIEITSLPVESAWREPLAILGVIVCFISVLVGAFMLEEDNENKISHI